MKRRKAAFEDVVTALTVSHQIRVRFNETDPLGIVWHGYYLTYFEDGREAFGRHHGISYLDIQKSGLTTPIVKSVCEHRLPLKYGDVARIDTSIVDTAAAKMIFRYVIYNERNQVVCSGETVQVFLDASGDLMLVSPAYFDTWKRKMGIIR
ncbi:MAG: acyl-CoA thioesterase [Chitinophagaceae bacterium]|nr:MAG: acyl-CoA thioesterase [Chitinophagaceae bacterium]